MHHTFFFVGFCFSNCKIQSTVEQDLLNAQKPLQFHSSATDGDSEGQSQRNNNRGSVELKYQLTSNR